ncbi:MAG: glycosyltransferase family 2 protein [Cyanobium sp.]
MFNIEGLRIAIIMMQKDEISLLPLFLRYHESQFGVSSLFIFDNGSTNSEVITELKSAEKRGVRIDWGYRGPKNFDNKGNIIAELIKNLDRTDPHDFYFPLDCDEFLACLTPEGVSTNRRDIDSALTPFKESPSTLRISHKYWANPLHRNRYQVSTYSPKCFFAKASCKFLDHGFHNAKSLSDAPDLTTPIVYYEFHYKTYLLHRVNSTAKLAPYLSDYSRKGLRQFVQRQYHNHHCAKDLLLSKYEYLKKFAISNYPIIDSSFLDEINQLSVDVNRLFERVPPSGIRLWIAWLKLRHTMSKAQAALQERWSDGVHIVQRILRRVISRP